MIKLIKLEEFLWISLKKT